jgi:outer membrane lipoprotein-sorting protein
MPRYKLLFSLLLALSLIPASGSQLANAKAERADVEFQDTSPSTMLSNGKNGAPVLEEMVRHVNEMGDYKFEGIVAALRGKTVIKAAGVFYYKPHDEIRVEVKDYGSKSGSVLVKRRDGKVVGKAGKQMFGIKLTLTPSSRLLQLPNGVSALESDLMSLFNRVKKEVSSGEKLVSTDQPIKVASVATPVIVLESQASGASGPEVVDRIFIDPSQKLPVQWDLYENGKFLSRCWFSSYQPKEHWDESEFNL